MLLTNAKKSSSDRIDIPNSLASSSFDPAFSPATRCVVFLVTEFVICQPEVSIIFFASDLFIKLKDPVNTNVLSIRELDDDFF